MNRMLFKQIRFVGTGLLPRKLPRLSAVLLTISLLGRLIPMPTAIGLTAAARAQATTIFSANFDTGAGDNAWTINPNGTDTATAGAWARGIQPAYSMNGNRYQVQLAPLAGSDLATGLANGQVANVNGGITTARSPAFVLPANQKITLGYSYYFGASGPMTNAYFRVRLISAATNAVLADLHNIANIPQGADAIWTPYTANLSAYGGQTVYLRVEASDTSNIVFEAAIDNVLVTAEAHTELSGQVWHDVDNDGLLEGGEGGMDGIFVELLDANQLPVDDPALPGFQPAYRFTDASGAYAFKDIAPGNYIVRIVTPPGDFGISSANTVTSDNQTDNDDNGIQAEDGRMILSPVINIAAGETDNTIDFGLVDSPVLPEFLYSNAPVFTWRNATNTAGAIWNASDTSRTWTTSYTDIYGNPNTVDVTMTIVDPDNRNGDPDLHDAGSHPFDPAGGCFPFPGVPASDTIPGDGSLVDPWDSDCILFSTETSGGYGPDYLSVSIKTQDSSERVTYRFTFSKVIKISNLSVGDIDYVGVDWDAHGGSDGLLSPYESPGDSYQDRVEIYAWRAGDPVAVSFTNGGNLTFADGTSFATYNENLNGNVLPDDPTGTTTFSTATGIDSFEIVYSNGSADGARERYKPVLYNWWSTGNGGTTYGVSDNHAIRISGFGLVAADTANISGAVYVDTDNDGSGDTPLAGVEIQLLDTVGNPVLDATGAPVQPVFTGSDGSYLFTNLVPGNYQVVEIQPAGYEDVVDGDTTTPGDDAPNTNTLDNVIPVSVVASETDTGNDFVEVRLGTLTVIKNTAGSDDTFTFSSPDGELDGLTIATAANTGSSDIFTKTAGTYIITEDALSGWALTDIAISGDTDGQSTVNTATGEAAIDLDAGENITVTFTNESLPPALSLQKTLVSPANGIAEVGDTIIYALRVENTGQVDVAEVTLTDRYDSARLTFSTASALPDAQATGTLTWTGQVGGADSLSENLPLAPGDAFTITVEFIATAP
ncbi:MAG: SdrD B-like domain-containing protein [Caldilineaceae bacterium]